MASHLFEGKNIMKTLKNIIRRCEVCQKNNPKTGKLARSGLQQSGKYPGGDWDIYFTHMPKTNGYCCLQVWMDTFSRWIEAFPCRSEQAAAAAAAAAAVAKSRQSCLTLCDPVDSSPPSSPSLGFSRQEHWSGLPFPSPSEQAKEVIKILIHEIIPRFGLSRSLQSDNGSTFKAAVSQGVSKALGIEYHLHCSWRPQSSGKAEKANNIIKRHLC